MAAMQKLSGIERVFNKVVGFAFRQGWNHNLGRFPVIIDKYQKVIYFCHVVDATLGFE